MKLPKNPVTSFAVGVDKIKVGLVFESYKEAEYEQVRQWGYSVKDQIYGLKGKTWSPHVAGSLTNVSQPLSYGGYLFVRYGRNNNRFRVWFEFNPNRVDGYELSGHLNQMLHYGFASLRDRGVVASCEFFVDIDNEEFGDYLYFEGSTPFPRTV